MSGASIETTLELWASSLREVKRRMRPLFTQERVARSAEHFLDGLLGEERRKTDWMRAEAAAIQALGVNRPSSVAGSGTRTPYATSCATMCSRHSPTTTRFSSLTRRAS